MPSSLATPARSRALAGTAGEHDPLRVLLVRLTVALNRRRAYAPAHPMVTQAEEALVVALGDVLAAKPSFTLGVAHRELLLDGEPLAGEGATARELAERLHRRGVGAITFEGTVSVEAARAALTWLATDPRDTGPRAAGGAMLTATAGTVDEAPALAGISIARVAYDRLALSDDEDAGTHEIAALWRSLAAVAFDDADDWVAIEGGASRAATTGGGGVGVGHAGANGTEPGDGTATDATAEDIAHAIERRVHEPGYVKRVGMVVQSVASQLQGAPPEVREEIAVRLRAVLQRLSQSNLGEIIRAAGNGREQRRYISALIDVLPATAIVDWLEVTAQATEQQLSHHMVRILTKLSAHWGQRRAVPETRDELRASAHALVDGWELDDPNPIEHGALLDFIAGRQVRTPAVGPGVPDEGADADRVPPDEDAVRLVQMACEIDVVCPEAQAAAEALVASGHVALLFSWLAEAPGQTAARILRDAATSPDALLGALLKQPFDAGAARALLKDLDLSAAPTLLTALERATLRTARRMLLNTLRSMGPALAPLLRERLNGTPPWYFTRNLLLLLRDVTVDTPGDESDDASSGSLLSFFAHPKEQVRIEALRLLLEVPEKRDAAIRRALEDSSPKLVASAIEAAAAAARDSPAAGVMMTRDITLRLMRLVEAHVHDQSVLSRAVRALEHLDDPMIPEWLVAQVARRSRFLRRPMLAEATPTVLAALHVLACRHAGDPRAAAVIHLAQRRDARDPRRAAVDAAARAKAPL